MYVKQKKKFVIPLGHIVDGIEGDGETEHEIDPCLTDCIRMCVENPTLDCTVRSDLKACIDKLISILEEGVFADNSEAFEKICKKLQDQIAAIEKICDKFETNNDSDEKLLKCLQELKESLECKPVDFTGIRKQWSTD